MNQGIIEELKNLHYRAFLLCKEMDLDMAHLKRVTDQIQSDTFTDRTQADQDRIIGYKDHTETKIESARHEYDMLRREIYEQQKQLNDD